jgi:hypothetical protein
VELLLLSGSADNCEKRGELRPLPLTSTSKGFRLSLVRMNIAGEVRPDESKIKIAWRPGGVPASPDTHPQAMTPLPD